MSKHFRRHKPRPKKYYVDSMSVGGIIRSKEYNQKRLLYEWEYYNDIAFQRSKCFTALKNALLKNCKPFEFSDWQRGVAYPFTLDPLGTDGSLISPGGRFNIGTIDTTKFQTFPALYIAENKATVFAEMFLPQNNEMGFSPEELALSVPDSLTIIRLRGKLNCVLDVSDKASLQDFVDIIKEFKISKHVLARAEELQLEKPRLIQTTEELLKQLTHPDWRFMPQQLDVPAAPQIFGQIANAAEIEGILFPSCKTEKNCLAIFPASVHPQNSFVEIVGDVPAEIKRRRLERAKQ